MNSTATFLYLLAKVVFVVCAAFGVTLIYSFAWPQLFSTMTPPGAQGINTPFLLLFATYSAILAVCSYKFSSSAPSISAALIISWPLASFAYVDSRTELGVTFLGISPFIVYRRAIVATLVLVVIFIVISILPALIKKKNAQQGAAANP